MQTAHELFLHELSDMLDAERKILDGLGEQIDESSRNDLKTGLEKHREQTETQIQRLEQCFEELDAEPEDTECTGVRGILEEHENFKQENPPEDLIDFFNVGACSKIEHYEIASYETLIRMADLMEHKKVSKLLNQNLKEEQQMLKKVEQLSTKIQPENLGMDEEEEDMEEVDELDVEGDVDEETQDTGARKRSTGAKKSPRRGRAA
jgi:ferritin-like metal-binding protein YciE